MSSEPGNGGIIYGFETLTGQSAALPAHIRTHTLAFAWRHNPVQTGSALIPSYLFPRGKFPPQNVGGGGTGGSAGRDNKDQRTVGVAALMTFHPPEGGDAQGALAQTATVLQLLSRL